MITFAFKPSDFLLDWTREKAFRRGSTSSPSGSLNDANRQKWKTRPPTCTRPLACSSFHLGDMKRKKMVGQVCFTLISVSQLSHSLPALRSPPRIWSHLYLPTLRASSISRNFLSETQNISPDRMDWWSLKKPQELIFSSFIEIFLCSQPPVWPSLLSAHTLFFLDQFDQSDTKRALYNRIFNLQSKTQGR